MASLWGVQADEAEIAAQRTAPVLDLISRTPDEGHAVHYARVAEGLRAEFGKYPRYREVAYGPQTVDGVVGQSLCLEAEEEGELLRFRFIMLLPANGQNGVMITMIATRFAPEIKTPLDLGRVGDTAEILRSFRWQQSPQSASHLPEKLREP